MGGEGGVVNEVCIVLSFIIWLCLTRTGNYKLHEFDWLKSILGKSRPASRPVMFCSEKMQTKMQKY